MMDAHQHLLSRYHRQGDAEAFAVLVREHGGMVFATARRVTGDAALAEDVAQETFLELARSGQGRVKTVAAWLHRVAWSKACNARRGESRRRRHEDQAAVAAEIASSSASGEPAWEELETQVDAALNELPEALRELLVAHYLEGRTQQEMAARAGVSQSTISRQLEAGVCELRTNLRRQGMMCGAGLAVFLIALQLTRTMNVKRACLDVAAKPSLLRCACSHRHQCSCLRPAFFTRSIQRHPSASRPRGFSSRGFDGAVLGIR